MVTHTLSVVGRGTNICTDSQYTVWTDASSERKATMPRSVSTNKTLWLVKLFCLTGIRMLIIVSIIRLLEQETLKDGLGCQSRTALGSSGNLFPRAHSMMPHSPSYLGSEGLKNDYCF